MKALITSQGGYFESEIVGKVVHVEMPMNQKTGSIEVYGYELNMHCEGEPFGNGGLYLFSINEYEVVEY